MKASAGRKARMAVLSVALLSGALMFAGCTGGDQASSGTQSGGGSSAESNSTANRDAYDLKLAACLREAGFDVPDPQPGQGFTDTSPDISAAASTCAEKIGPPPGDLTEADMAAIDAQYLKWAQCFRERGYTVSDPVSGQAFAVPESATESDTAACTAGTP